MITTVSDIDFKTLTSRTYTPSPVAWEDQVLYFLMLDRFSDNNEKGYKDLNGIDVTAGTTELFNTSDNGNAIGDNLSAKQWREAGNKWCGGTLKGLESKLGYLKRLGITAIWVSPIFKQVEFHETYHGYGIQNFLEIDKHFGTKEDLKSLVDTAHSVGIYIVLDIILNHSGDVFTYNTLNATPPWRITQEKYPVKGFKNAFGNPDISFEKSNPGDYADNDAIFPVEMSAPETFTQKGKINNWDYFPEYIQGDFENLKDIHLGSGELNYYQPSEALLTLCYIYKYWIAYADIDGFRVDTVKHMDQGATRFFASAINEFTQSIGKENFYLIGEITGGRQFAFETMKRTGIGAALGISDIPGKLEAIPKGYEEPKNYFDLFRNSTLVGQESHTWFRNHVVTIMDDHDQVRKGTSKARFAAQKKEALIPAMGMQLLTLGIPCIYYGTEQALDGEGGNDRYLRECMFGGKFGAFRSKNRHCFNEENFYYKAIADILKVRSKHKALRRGRQYLRQISGDGIHFGFPQKVSVDDMKSIIVWSRIFNNEEYLCAINTDLHERTTAWSVIDYDLHQAGDQMTCLFSTDDNEIDSSLTVHKQNLISTIQLTVPVAGFVIYTHKEP